LPSEAQHGEEEDDEEEELTFELYQRLQREMFAFQQPEVDIIEPTVQPAERVTVASSASRGRPHPGKAIEECEAEKLLASVYRDPATEVKRARNRQRQREKKEERQQGASLSDEIRRRRQRRQRKRTGSETTDTDSDGNKPVVFTPKGSPLYQRLPTAILAQRTLL